MWATKNSLRRPYNECINNCVYLCTPTTSLEQYGRKQAHESGLFRNGSWDPWNSGPSLLGPKRELRPLITSLTLGGVPVLLASAAVNLPEHKWPRLCHCFSQSSKSQGSSPARPPWSYLNSSLLLLRMCPKIIITPLTGLMWNVITYANSFIKILCEEQPDTPVTVLGSPWSPGPTTKSYQDGVHPSVQPAEAHQHGEHHGHHQPQAEGVLRGRRGHRDVRWCSHTHRQHPGRKQGSWSSNASLSLACPGPASWWSCDTGETEEGGGRCLGI